MKSHLRVLLLAGALALAPSARAETTVVPEPEQSSKPAKVFFGAVRLGVGIPTGDTYNAGPAMRSIFEPEGQLMFDLGGMVTPHLFVGAYVGAGIGRQAVATDQFGDRRLASTGRIGAQVHYQFAPGELVKPWIGYGLGVSGAWLTDYGEGHQYTELLGGIEYAHLMAGIDFDLGANVGLGLFIDYSVGEYFLRRREVAGVVEFDGNIGDRGVHQWFVVGPRLSF